MFYVAFCDDEPEDISQLIRYLNELGTTLGRIQSVPFYHGREILESYREGKRYDLVVLDMVMEPMCGITIAKKIREYDSTVPIIIVTATAAYAMEGYKVQAYRYILKPVVKEQFLNCVKEILKIAARDSAEYFSFISEQGLRKLRLCDIYYFQCLGNRIVSVVTTEGNYSFTSSLKKIEDTLPEEFFIRQHKSYVINLRKVFSIRGIEVVMENKEVLPLSGRKGKETREKLLQYMRSSV